jgi:hypothetical protein
MVAYCANVLSCWYKRQELGFRAALFFSAAALAGSFGGLLAAAITQMDGAGGYEGWRCVRSRFQQCILLTFLGGSSSLRVS